MKKLLIIALALLSVSIVRADEGMWLLSKLKPLNIEKMQQMGFKLTAEDIYDVNKPGIKDAIVGLGNAGRPFRHFCSGEIISPNGLMLTNHHCGFSAIQSHSSVEHDYLADGFWAYKMESRRDRFYSGTDGRRNRPYRSFLKRRYERNGPQRYHRQYICSDCEGSCGWNEIKRTGSADVRRKPILPVPLHHLQRRTFGRCPSSEHGKIRWRYR